MDDTDGPRLGALGQLLQETIRFARGGQRIVDLAGSLTQVSLGIADLAGDYPDLAPEILAAMKCCKEAADALQRAGVALDAITNHRVDAVLETIPEEGGPS